jgi:hypothetical protein
MASTFEAMCSELLIASLINTHRQTDMKELRMDHSNTTDMFPVSGTAWRWMGPSGTEHSIFWNRSRDHTTSKRGKDFAS